MSKDKYSMYTDIGHDLGEISTLWIFRDGKIEASSIINSDWVAHDTIFNEDDGKWEVSGRYDPKKLIISMAGAFAFGWSTRRADYVKKKLWKRFPEALKIEEFK